MKKKIQLSKADKKKILEIRDFLEIHSKQHFTILWLAREWGMNRTKLNEHFKQVTGQTIYAYLVEIRMQHALKLLASGEHSVKEIAFACGYKAARNFSSAFKKHFGTRPRSFKGDK